MQEISETQISETPLANSCMRYSAHTFGEERMGPLEVLPHHLRILKKCTQGCEC
jgi:hypothetical protein